MREALALPSWWQHTAPSGDLSHPDRHFSSGGAESPPFDAARLARQTPKPGLLSQSRGRPCQQQTLAFTCALKGRNGRLSSSLTRLPPLLSRRCPQYLRWALPQPQTDSDVALRSRVDKHGGSVGELILVPRVTASTLCTRTASPTVNATSPTVNDRQRPPLATAVSDRR